MKNTLTSKKARRKGIKGTQKKPKPDIRINIGPRSNRVHIDVRLTAAQEIALYRALHKRYGQG